MYGIKNQIWINSGHSIYDCGAVSGKLKESEYTMKIRDKVLELLNCDGYLVDKIYKVPDNLNLSKSIRWVNQYTKNLNDGLALSVHLNSGGGRGIETYYFNGSSKSKELAQIMQDEIIKTVSPIYIYKDRGVKSDLETRFKRLGWIRQTNCWAILTEVGFIDSEKDMEFINSEQGITKIAQGIVNGVCEILGINNIGVPSDIIDPTLISYNDIATNDIATIDVPKNIKKLIINL